MQTTLKKEDQELLRKLAQQRMNNLLLEPSDFLGTDIYYQWHYVIGSGQLPNNLGQNGKEFDEAAIYFYRCLFTEVKLMQDRTFKLADMLANKVRNLAASKPDNSEILIRKD